MLKDIGEELKEKRIAIGISIDEVSSDLKIDSLIIENLEEGNQKVFQDVLELKKITIAYAKYLGFEEEEMEEELNDYLFEKTSKISLEDIKKELEIEKTKPQEVKIHSPYTTVIKEKNNRMVFWVVVIALCVAIFVLLYFILSEALMN